MQGIKTSQPRVAKLMREENIRSIIRMKYLVTTASSHKYPVVDNKFDQRFSVKKMNQAWVSDLTYVATADFFPLIDLR
jgi:transposase InsO family protein